MLEDSITAATARRKRRHWELEMRQSEENFLTPLPATPLFAQRKYSHNADTVNDVLVEMKGDIEVWKRFESRVKGFKAVRPASISEKISRIIEAQLRSTQENVQRVEEIAQKQRGVISGVDKDEINPENLAPNSFRDYPSEVEYGDDEEPKVKRMRYSMPEENGEDRSKEVKIDSPGNLKYLHDTTKIEENDSAASSGKMPSGVAKVFGFFSKLINRGPERQFAIQVKSEEISPVDFDQVKSENDDASGGVLDEKSSIEVNESEETVNDLKSPNEDDVSSENQSENDALVLVLSSGSESDTER